METLWLIPVHVRPVVSLENISRGRIIDPVSGQDRLNLTDVGGLLFNRFTEKGALVKLKWVRPPYPWEMIFRRKETPIASLRGTKVGSSTYRSIFKLLFDGESAMKIVSECMKELGRDPLKSPYWKDDTWEIFSRDFRLSRDSVISSNRTVIDNL